LTVDRITSDLPPEGPPRSLVVGSQTLGYLIFFAKNNPISIVGAGIVTCIGILTVIAPWVVPYDPERVLAGQDLHAPSSAHWFGTDSSGLDVFSRVVAATRTDIPVAISATLVSLIIGVGLGVAAGYFGNRRGIGGFLGESLLRVMDVLQAFPVFILAMALVAAAGSSSTNVGIAIAFVNMPIFLRLVRGQVLALRDTPFVEAARCSGASPAQVAYIHILPSVVSPALIQASVTIGFAILLTAGLSFVGAGVPPPTPEWGLMIADGSHDILTGQWWTSVFPGGALALTVLGFALTGEALARAVDPLQRR
jgi:peptide/nickel transport system permease protein